MDMYTISYKLKTERDTLAVETAYSSPKVILQNHHRRYNVANITNRFTEQTNMLLVYTSSSASLSD